MMIDFKQDDDFLSKESKDFIDHEVLGLNFSFFHKTRIIEGDDRYNGFFEHTILRAGEDNWNSKYHPWGEGILQDFVSKNNLTYKLIHRMSINLTYNNGMIKCPVHKDHLFPHKQLIVYLNDVQDKKAKLFILDDDEKKILKKVTPKQYRGVCFNNSHHWHYHPRFGERLAFVTTFE